MKKLMMTMMTAIVLAAGSVAEATVTPLLNGLFEVTYEYNLQLGTLHGSDITDIFMFASDDDDMFSLDYTATATAPGQGVGEISYILPFDPTGVLVIGLDRAPISPDLKDHLVVLMDKNFAADALSKPKFSGVFPAVEGRDRLRHSVLVQAVIDAGLGDEEAKQILQDFYLKDAGQFAAFDPNDTFRVLEFSAPVPIDVVPEPASMILLGSGLVGMAGLRHRQKRS